MSGKTVFILLFRGVGGATQLPVAPLRALLAEAGFENAGTYINSGNAYLRTGMERDAMLAAVARICRNEFGFTKDIHVRSLAEWEAIVDANPFPEAIAQPKFLHAAVLAAEPDPARVDALRGHAVAGEDIAVNGRVAYLSTPHGFGTSKLAGAFDKGVGVPNTARNWNTVTKLLELARAAR